MTTSTTSDVRSPSARAGAPSQTAAAERQRLQVFCSSVRTEVFHAVVHPLEIWKQDPLDVETIHEPARQVFGRLMNQAATGLPSGRILLLLGEAGSGKTHLMRAFRNYVHSQELGYCGYLQLTSHVSNYARYVLGTLIDALDKPYLDPINMTTGLMRLSTALLDNLPLTRSEEREQFRDKPFTVPELARRVFELADCALLDSRFSQIDVDILRALLYLQRDDPRIKTKVLKFLRCEDLAPYDREMLGDIVPRTQEEDPLDMIAKLGQLMWALQSMPLVCCSDQLEDITVKDDGPKGAERFCSAMETLVAIGERLPSSVVVIACLEEYYEARKGLLQKPKLDRIEKDPEPVRLASGRSAEEIKDLVSLRLQFLFEMEDVPFDKANPIFPFATADLDRLAGLRTRDVLENCRAHREQCISAGAWQKPEEVRVGEQKQEPATTLIEQAWNNFRATHTESLPDDEKGLARLLGWAIQHSSPEIPTGHWFTAEADGRMVPVEIHGSDNSVSRLLVAICNKDCRGKGLANQIAEVEKQAGDNPAVIVRTVQFPKSPKSDVMQTLADFMTKGGWRRQVVEDADWRAMAAFRAFLDKQPKSPEMDEWRRAANPLTGLPSLQKILALDQLLPASAAKGNADRALGTGQAQAGAQGAMSSAQSTAPDLFLGTSRNLTSSPVTMPQADIILHAAFLGGPGSGKTTAALNLVEQLLARGIPVVLVDRKGDLCGYADDQGWNRPLADPAETARRRALRERLNVAVFTPGNATGRPLSLRVLPQDLIKLKDDERQQLAGYVAASLAAMMGYKPRGPDQVRLAVLRQAIELLGALPNVAMSVLNLIKFIADKEPSLVTAVGVIDVNRQFRTLAENLQTLWLNNRDLLDEKAECLDMDLLLGRGKFAQPGKTRLSVISTRFLSSDRVEFWVAQLLVETARWSGRNPSKTLQAVLLFDEADLYLPATKQPATKLPMENLLRRSRSTGVGLFLATQSPGDFDYKCRDNIYTWFIGKVGQPTAIEKIKALADGRADITAKLASQQTGEFQLLRPARICSLAAHPSLLKTEQLPEERILKLARATCR